MVKFNDPYSDARDGLRKLPGPELEIKVGGAEMGMGACGDIDGGGDKNCGEDDSSGELSSV